MGKGLIAAALFATLGIASASAQEDCGRMYNRVMQAYQMQSPQYAQMLHHYNVRCASGAGSGQGPGVPGWREERQCWTERIPGSGMGPQQVCR